MTFGSKIDRIYDGILSKHKISANSIVSGIRIL